MLRLWLVFVHVFPDLNEHPFPPFRQVAAGARVLTVHGRTREMKGITTGLADWSQIRAVKQAVSVPVYANGNIQFMSNADQCMAETGADGVVVAEALLHNPAFFSSRHVPCWRLCDQYLSFYDTFPTHLSHVRAHLFKMLHHVLQLPENVNLRDAMTMSKTIADLKEIVESVRKLYEIESQDQTLEMTTLPVPVHVSQPMFRGDRVLGLSHEVADSKRQVASADDAGVGKKRKKGKEDRVKLAHCVRCKNPRGLKCRLLFCRTCCLAEGPKEFCESHSKIRKKEKNNSIGHDV